MEERVFEGLIRGEDGRIRPVWACANDLMRNYYDFEWGRRVHTDQEYYERICLEGFQVGLSWQTVLAKRPAFRETFAGFDPEQVAQFTDADVARLLEDPAIIRNEQKIRACIANANATLALTRSGDPLHRAIPRYAPDPQHWHRPATPAEAATVSQESKDLAKFLKRSGMKFVGPVTCFALMEAVGLIDNRPQAASGLID